MADMQELIALLETAEAGSRDLNGLIFRYFGEPVPTEFAGRGIKLEWQDDGTAVMPIGDMHVRYSPPSYSTSLDAALALAGRVLEGDFSYDLFHDFGEFNRAKVHGITDGPVSGEGKAETMPLALCIAILKAKAQGEGG